MAMDRYSGDHAAASPAAVAAYERAVWNLLAHRPGLAPALDDAFGHQPDFTAAVALRGFGGVSLAREETIAAARIDCARARGLLDRRGGTSFEHAMVEALECAVDGRLLEAADRLDARLAEAPHDALSFKLAHGLRFLGGDATGMLASARACAPHWSASMEAYGFLSGCHAFALEENGHYADAERIGDEAAAHEPCDAWGVHAVGHVHEMRNDVARGMRWLEQTQPAWSACNNFAFHMAWHLALCHLAQDRADRALELYDQQVRPVHTDDFRDVANAVSLLWRLRQDGVDVGRRWDELAALARKRARDTSLVFASLHHLLTLAAVGDAATARELVSALRERADAGGGDQARVAREIGVELAQAFSTLGERGQQMQASALAGRLDPLGGSRAQRDIFVRTLALIAVEAGDGGTVDKVLQFRGRTGPDRFERFARLRLAATSGPRQVA